MGRCPASSLQPAVAAVFRAPVVVALVVPMDRGMVMTDHDELLARADWVLNVSVQERIDARIDIEDVIADLAAALRVALTENERLRHALTNVADNLHGGGLISDVAKADILRVVAGSAAPTGDNVPVSDGT